MTRITHIVVHYTATFPDQPVTREIVDRWHRERGWSGIGYHWLVTRDGVVEAGRPEHVTGAHVANRNTGTIGVCWAGGLDRASGPNVGVKNMTPVQERALVSLLREIKARHPQAEIVGHKDLAATLCPGFDVRSWWAAHERDRQQRETAALMPAPVVPRSYPSDPLPTARPPEPAPVGFWGWLRSLFRA
jgi:N-acetylmuramoyl-L-alanine amidase